MDGNLLFGYLAHVLVLAKCYIILEMSQKTADCY